jgi:putative inorganic carbon (HCO3(-)) transporter
MQNLRMNVGILSASIIYILVNVYFCFQGEAWTYVIPLALLSLFFAVFYRKTTFLALAFFVGISVNIEEFTTSVGLFVPTEPLCFGLMLLMLLESLQKSVFPKYTFSHPITLAIILYLTICLIASVSSSHPLVSLKFIVAKLWFVIPFVFFAPQLFEEEKFLKKFIWLLVIGMSLTMTFTLVHHAMYGFGDKESHWVMFPFFKDHTIYGCLVAFMVPITYLLFKWSKGELLMRFVTFSLLTLNIFALIFSYTRAAWVSIFIAIGVLGLIHFRVKFKYLALIGALVVSYLMINWTEITFALAKNKAEHTTANIGERFESAGNVTTDASNLERINRWSCAIEMFNERPILGYGPGTYAFEYARFQEPENTTIISTNFGEMGNAHSEYLGPLAETGILGLIAILILVATIFYKSITCYIFYRSKDEKKATILLAIIASFTTFFIHGLLNNYWDTDKISIPVFAFCAVVIAFDYQRGKETLTH